MTRPRIHGTHPEASQLINDAQERACELLRGVPVTPESLARLAATTREAILQQVALGQWSRLGPTDRDQMDGLKVRCVLGNVLLGEMPIKFEYDFARTALPGLLVEAIRRGAN